MSRVRITLSIALAAVALTSSIGLHADEGPSPYAAWSVGGFGMSIGTAGLVVAGSGANAEIYVPSSYGYGGYHSYWFSVRRTPGTNQYEQDFISESFTKEIRRLALFHTPVAERPLAIAVAFADGAIHLYDQKTKKLLGTDTDPCSAHTGLLTMTTRDMDGDGWDEFVSLCQDGAVAAHGYTYPAWVFGGSDAVYRGDLVTGQMDDDPAIEIAITIGRAGINIERLVIDSGTHAVQWTRTSPYGEHLQATDIDGDGRDELIAAEGWRTIVAYDVERQLPKWSLSPWLLDDGTFLVDDVDGDGVKELMIPEDFGTVRAYSTATQLEEWVIPSDLAGVTNFAAADVNDDGVKELIWGAGADSTGKDRLFVANWVTRTITWQNQQLDGLFLGPEVGDLDGDGVPELVFASTTSESGYYSGRIVVVDSRTMKVRAVFAGAGGGIFARINDIKLRDVNKDGRLEIVIAGWLLYDGFIEVYSLDTANKFTLTWTNATRPDEQAFYSVDVADIDGDGTLEVIGSSGRETTGAAGTFIYVYDAATRNEKFHTLQIGPYWSKLTWLVVAQLDDDAALEFAGLVENGAVYVFDGATRALEATIGVVGSSMSAVRPGFGLKGLLIGNTTGHVGLWTYNGTSYGETSGWNFGTRPINGVQLTPDGALAVGSGGAIHVLREGAMYHSANYGVSADYSRGFGRSLLSMGGGRVLLSGGENGVHALIVHP
jgi:hypothetical protein